MENTVELDTRPLTAGQLRETLIAAHPRLAEVFGDEARGLAWRPPATKTIEVAETSRGRVLDDLDLVRWGNVFLEFTFGLSARYYEGEPREHTSFVLSLVKGTVIGFGLLATERPGQPITRVSFEWGFVADAQAAALRDLFSELLRPDTPRAKKRRKK